MDQELVGNLLKAENYYVHHHWLNVCTVILSYQHPQLNVKGDHKMPDTQLLFQGLQITDTELSTLMSYNSDNISLRHTTAV